MMRDWVRHPVKPNQPVQGRSLALYKSKNPKLSARVRECKTEAHLDSSNSTQHQYRAIQCPLNLNHKIDVPGRVNDVDRVSLPLIRAHPSHRTSQLTRRYFLSRARAPCCSFLHRQRLCLGPVPSSVPVHHIRIGFCITLERKERVRKQLCK